jgi:hypothetical protein
MQGKHGLLAEQAGGTSLKEVVGKVREVKNDMHSDVPENEFRRVDDLVFDSAIRLFGAARGDSTRLLKSYVRYLEAEIEGVKGSALPTTREPEVVPPHLDGRVLAGRDRELSTPAVDAQLGKGTMNPSDWRKNEDLERLRFINAANPASPTVTYTCTQITQNTPSSTNCENPPANNYPPFDFVLTAGIVATNSTTGAQTTTTFSTSGTASGMCEYYTDCDGDLVNDDFPGYADPSGGLTEDDGTAVGTAFWWVLSKYGPAANGACDCDNPDPDGTVWNYTFSNGLTSTFWVAESGHTGSDCAGSVLVL